ncbi:MAG: glycosyltransferase family 4 protein [Actinomycetota bacterium]
MHILCLAPHYPFPVQDGTQIRVDNLLRRFPADFRTTLVCFDKVDRVTVGTLPEPFKGTEIRVPVPSRPTGPKASQLAQLMRRDAGMIWKFHSETMERQVRELAAKADAVLAIGLQMGQYLTGLEPGIPTILDNYNVEWLILSRMAQTRPPQKRWFWQLEAQKLRRSEGEFLRRAGRVIAISDVDRQGMAALAPKALIEVIPNGVNGAFFGAVGPRPGKLPPRYAFVGAMNWHVNEDAAHWMRREIWPRITAEQPDAELYFVGREPSAEVRALADSPEIHVTGTVPDIRPFLEESVAVVVPLRYGSGIRNKILESFAAGRPVVSTSVGAEGLPVRNGEHLLIADTSAEFASACVRVAREPALADRLVTAGRSVVAAIDRHASAEVTRVFTQTAHMQQ